MPRVEALVLDGLAARFFSSDHAPPHFHLQRRGEWEVRVYFLNNERAMFDLVWGKEPSPAMLRLVADAVNQNRMALLREWTAKVKDAAR